ncbi:MAG TPA: iron ABC transporter substrate-binding protein [Xanthobacteraceae bacterium]|nr:iron ABC transporter substrate-binding protein [Xanthobacteraceae bacterium]
MQLDRRTLLAGLSTALLAPRTANSASVNDGAGRAVPVPARVERVFPAGPPAAILLYTLAPELLIGWPRTNRPEEREFLLPDVGGRPEVGRITGRGNTANLEAVLALKPDLILDVGSLNPTYVSLAERVQQQTGIPYALLDGRFDGISPAYRTLGALIGRHAQGEAFARSAEDMITTITRRIAAITPERRPRVYYARGTRGLETGLGGSINVETIELIARNVAGGTRGGLANVSIEQVLLWDPEVIITIDQDFAADVPNDPAWASVAAVRTRRVHLSPKLPFGWVDFPPSVNRLIGLWWLAKILYPDLFPEDLRALTRDFYSRFYHVTPNDMQIDRVLAGRD